MREVDELVEAARDLADGILRLASQLLGAGVDPERVHRRYVSASFELTEEIETRAVLASGGDRGALRRLELLVTELGRLSEEARSEIRDQADDDREA